jgi:hypothetical protein
MLCISWFHNLLLFIKILLFLGAFKSVPGSGEELNAHYICQYRVFHNVLLDYIYNKKTKGPTWMELFTATGILKKFFLDN